MVRRIFRGTAHGELIHVELAQDNRIFGFELGHYRSIIRRYEVFQNLGGTSRLYALGADIVLDGARDTFEERNLLTAGNLFVHSLGLSQSFVAGNGQICFNVAFHLVDARQHIFGELYTCNLFIHQHIMEYMSRFFI